MSGHEDPAQVRNVLALDVGGTAIKAAVFADGRVLAVTIPETGRPAWQWESRRDK